jgi:hypothetical protein
MTSSGEPHNRMTSLWRVTIFDIYGKPQKLKSKQPSWCYLSIYTLQITSDYLYIHVCMPYVHICTCMYVLCIHACMYVLCMQSHLAQRTCTYPCTMYANTPDSTDCRSIGLDRRQLFPIKRTSVREVVIELPGPLPLSAYSHHATKVRINPVKLCGIVTYDNVHTYDTKPRFV